MLLKLHDCVINSRVSEIQNHKYRKGASLHILVSGNA